MFEPNDFKSKGILQLMLGNDQAISIKDAAKYANEKLASEIDKWPIAYEVKVGFGTSWRTSLNDSPNPMRKGRIMFIEPIEKENKEHECIPRDDSLLSEPRCKTCGKSVRVKWVPKNETA